MKIKLNPVKALYQQEVEIEFGDLTVFFGKNNSGKTSILVGACNTFLNNGDFRCDYLSINRFYSDSSYSFQNENNPQNKQTREDQRKIRSGNTLGQNTGFDYIHELSIQDESVREKIMNFFSLHFEEFKFFEVKQGKYTVGLIPKINTMNPLDQGTGARAVLPIIIQLFCPDVIFLAIDEPEVSLEPNTQRIIFQAIKDASKGENGFPKKKIVIATHSHLFLDREHVENNYSVEKVAGRVSMKQLRSIDDLQQATYRLLGSNPGDLFFPTNIIAVEGESDKIFLGGVQSKMIKENILKKRNVVFHYLEGIDKAAVGLEGIVQMFKTQAYAPIYKDKICALFDKPNAKQLSIIESIRAFFNDTKKERFIVLDKPGIEYYYPLTIINKIFAVSATQESYEKELENFYKSISKQKPFYGTMFGKQVTKVEFASLVSNEFLTNGDLSNIDNAIRELLIKADFLAF
jgi:predicted ATPase